MKNLKYNMGSMDKTMRILAGLLIIGAYSGNYISGVTAIVLLIIAIGFIITSLIGFCPLYFPFKIDTRKK